MRQVEPVAAGLGLFSCHVCGLVSKSVEADGSATCPRCRTRIHFRKPNSVGSCWALLIAAYILYVPAVLLPIMETGSLLSYRKDTIMSGVVHLWKTGFWGIAAIVFIASIMVPLFKAPRPHLAAGFRATPFHLVADAAGPALPPGGTGRTLRPCWISMS